MSKEGGMPFVRFEVRQVEDRAASLANGHYTTKDVDFILLVPAGSGGKEQIEQVYSEWLEQRKVESGRHEIRTGDHASPMFAARFPDEWLTKIESGYKHWKEGQEIPIEGTSILNWAVLSPSQRTRLQQIHILTVEALAEAPDSALEIFGMGGITLRQRARDFIALNGSESNKTAAELEALRVENKSLRDKLDSILSRLSQLDANKKAA